VLHALGIGLPDTVNWDTTVLFFSLNRYKDYRREHIVFTPRSQRRKVNLYIWYQRLVRSPLYISLRRMGALKGVLKYLKSIKYLQLFIKPIYYRLFPKKKKDTRFKLLDAPEKGIKYEKKKIGMEEKEQEKDPGKKRKRSDSISRAMQSIDSRL
jgi:hypothetical protein